MAKGRVIPAFFVFWRCRVPAEAVRAIFIFAIFLSTKENRRKSAAVFKFKRQGRA
jgi:hypothetical protein